MNKIVFVKSKFREKGSDYYVSVPTGEKEKTFLGFNKDVTKIEKRWISAGGSDSHIDGVALAEDIQSAIDVLNSDGFDVVSISPVISGQYEVDWKPNASNMDGSCGGGGFGYGYGFSFTEGFLVLAKKS